MAQFIFTISCRQDWPKTMATETRKEPQSQVEDAGPSHEKQLKVTLFTVDSSLKHPALLVRDVLSGIQTGRELAWRMFVRNLRSLYRQTALGIFWAFLPPLANTAIWVLLRNVVNMGEGLDVAYSAYVLAGMVIWQSFIEALNAPLKIVRANKQMLSRLRFPRESILLVGIYETIFNLCIRLVVLIPILLIFLSLPSINETWQGIFWSWQTPVAILSVLLLMLLGFGIGLILMPFGMLYHDVGKFLTVATAPWMILTQIIYAPPENWAWSPFNWLNPASPLLLASRDLLTLGQTEHWIAAGVYGLIAIPILLLGVVVYRVSIPILVERI